MTTRNTIPLFALLLALGTLAGCLPEKQPTQLSLLNRTQEQLTARVVLHNYTSPDQVLARRALAPGDSAVMGPFLPQSHGSLELVLQRDDQFSEAPTRQNLSAGHSSWHVVTPVFKTYSAIELRRAPTDDPGWTTVPARKLNPNH